MGTVYLLHLSEPMPRGQSPASRPLIARHYMGYSENLKGRLYHHRNGTGARFTQVAHERGIEMQLVRTWKDKDRAFERRLKKQNHLPRLCPVCNGPKAFNREQGEQDDQAVCGI